MTESTRTILAVVGLVIFLLVGWRVLGAMDIVTAERIHDLVQSGTNVRASVWLAPIVVAIYSILLLVMFPLTILVIASGMIFGAWWGLFYAVMGTLASSALTFWVGRWLGHDTLVRLGGRRLGKASDYFSERGLRTMVVINLLPIAPFTLTNLMAGAFGLQFVRYMVGSAIGILPGLVAVTVLGSQLGALLLSADASDWADWAVPLTIGGACIGALVALPYIGRRILHR